MEKLMYLFLLILLLTGCQQEAPRGEYVHRLSSEHGLIPVAQEKTPPPVYPWQAQIGQIRAITKEYFRCKGSPLNPPNIIMKDGKEYTRFYDCQGLEKHSLPLRDGKEFVYPILITLLNHVQLVTGKNVIITSGHRCISHQAFIDPTPKGSSSKHLIGAEVDFYVQGYEDKPLKILQILMDYYKEDEKEYKTFQRFEKASDTSTPPWLNKEIFIKLYKRDEGRNFDNRHTYPYITIQVRFDREKNEKVTFSPEQAQSLLRK